MKTIITAAAALFAFNVSAADIYHGLDEGNTDLSAPRLSASEFAGVQPSVGDSVDRYHGLADGNPDLFKAEPGVRSQSTGSPNIYGVVSGNQDLQF